MLKAALLYGDGTTLYSVTTSMVLTMLSIGTLNPRQKIDFLESVLPSLSANGKQVNDSLKILSLYRKIISKKHLSPSENIFKLQFSRQIEKSFTEMSKTINNLAQEAGAEGLIKAINSGLLNIHIFQFSQEGNSSLITSFIDKISDSLFDGKTYPLLDDRTGDIIRFSIAEGKIEVPPSSALRGKNTSLAASLLERLPLFDLASIDEILEIRRDLSRPLTRFRGAIFKFTEQIKCASWDKDFAFDVDRIFHQEVAPSVLDLEEEIKSNFYLNQLIKKFVDKSLIAVSGSALGLAVSSLTNFPMIASQALGVSASATFLALDTYTEWQNKQKGIEHNQLFFYYRAGKLLSNRS